MFNLDLGAYLIDFIVRLGHILYRLGTTRWQRLIEFLKNYLPYYKHYRTRLIVAFISMVLVAMATASIAYMVKPLLDEIFINKDETLLYILPLFVILAYIVKGVGTYIQAYYMSYIGQDIVRQIRDKLLNHILKLEFSFFHKYHSGELLSRVTNDVNRIQDAISLNLANFIRETITAIALITIVFYQSPKLALFVFIVIPASYYPVMVISKRLKKISHLSQEKNSDLTSSLSEIFSNIEVIKSYNTEEYESKKFAKFNKSFFDINMKSVRTSELVVPIMELFAAISAAAVIIIGGKSVIDGQMSVGSFFTFMTAMFMAVDPVRRVSVSYSKFQDAVAAHERIEALMHLSTERSSGGKGLASVDSLVFDSACLKYDEAAAIESIELSIKKGDIVAFVGGSGGGKSSTINLILRFFDASSGRVLINGEDLKSYDLHALREKISIVTQRIYIFNDTVAANVAYGEEIDEKRVINALKRANIYEHVESLENGIYTVLSEAGTNLSGGQRQRIAIARALYKEPQILILDEATSALDNQSEDAIIETINKISKDIITIIVTHRLKPVNIANSVYLFKEGKIACRGTKEQLLQNCEEFKELHQ